MNVCMNTQEIVYMLVGQCVGMFDAHNMHTTKQTE